MMPEGLFVPNITPFDARGEIMYDALDRLLEFWIEEGVSGVVVNASTGEGPYLDREEKKAVIYFALEKLDGRGRLFAGTGSMGTKDTITLTRDAMEAGAEAALVTTPFFFRPSDEEIYEHYISLMSSVDLPVILYNVPKFTGYSVSPAVVARIAEECSNLVAVKDSSGNPGTMSEVIRLCGDRISALSGSADMILPTLMLGGKGAIVAIANAVPATCVSILDSYKAGDIAGAGANQLTASRVNKVLVRELPQIAAIKAALSLIGYEAGEPRRPLRSLPEELTNYISESLKDALDL